MANRLTKVVTQEYIPAVAAVAAQPARCRTETRTVLNLAYTGEASYEHNAPGQQVTGSVSVTDQSIGVGGGGTITLFSYAPAESSGTRGPSQGYRDQFIEETYEVCTPAVTGVAGTPARTDYIPILGWNGGANSYDLLTGSGFFRFRTTPTPVGVVAGITSFNASNSLGDAEHAFYITGSNGYIIESGTVVATITGLDVTTAPVCYIMREGTEVTYRIPAIGYSYTSAKPSYGAKYADVALYASGDYVDDPAIGVFKASFATISAAPAMSIGRVERTNPDGTTDTFISEPNTIYARISSGINLVALVFADGVHSTPVTISNNAAFNAAGTHSLYELDVTMSSGIAMSVSAINDNAVGGIAVPAMLAIGADESEYSQGEFVVPAITTEGESGYPTVEYATGELPLPPIGFSSVGYSGGVATVDWVVPAFRMIAADEDGYGQGTAELPPFYTIGNGGFRIPGQIDNLEALWFIDGFTTPSRVYAFFESELELTDEITAVIVVETDYYEGLIIQPSWDLSRVITAIMSSELVVNSNTTAQQQEAIQYAINVATGGVSRYTGFNFDGFTTTDYGTFAWDSAGVYRLRPGDDAGTPIYGAVDFGQVDWGNIKSKYLDNVYLGISTDGQVFARIKGDDGAELVYRVRKQDRSARVNTGKGKSARKWNVTLELVDASNAQLDSVEYVFSTSTRRWVK